jgi:hypothetical protein
MAYLLNRLRRWAHYKPAIFGGAEQPPVPPTTILGANLYAWYDRRGRWQNANGTTPATAFNDPVRRWSDQSGNARHLDYSAVWGSTDPTLLGPTLDGVPCVGSGLIENNDTEVRVLVSGGDSQNGFEGQKDFTFIGVCQSGEESYTFAFKLDQVDNYWDKAIYHADIDTDPDEAAIIQVKAFEAEPYADLELINYDGPGGESRWNQQGGPQNFTIPPRIVGFAASWTRANIAMWVNGEKFPSSALTIANPELAADTGKAVIVPNANHLTGYTYLIDYSRYWEIIIAEGIPTDVQMAQLHTYLSRTWHVGLSGYSGA